MINFSRFCSLTFHVDGGANCSSVKDKSLFCFFVEGNGEITSVAGTKVKSQGWGAILMKFGDKICLVGPLYYFPNHPQNTLSPGLLMNYNMFVDATVRTNRQFEFLPPKADTMTTLPFNIHNDLDFATFHIMSMKPSPDHVIANFSANSNPLRRSARLALKSSPMINDDIHCNNNELQKVGTVIGHRRPSSDAVIIPSFYVVNNALFSKQYRNIPTKVGTRVILRPVFDKIMDISQTNEKISSTTQPLPSL